MNIVSCNPTGIQLAPGCEGEYAKAVSVPEHRVIQVTGQEIRSFERLKRACLKGGEVWFACELALNNCWQVSRAGTHLAQLPGYSPRGSLPHPMENSKHDHLRHPDNNCQPILWESHHVHSAIGGIGP